MDDGVDAAQGVAEGQVVGEVAEGDLHVDALDAEAPGVAHEAAHRRSRRDEAAQQRLADRSGGPGEKQHDAGAYLGADP